MKMLIVLLFYAVLALAPDNALNALYDAENYEVVKTRSTSSGESYEIKCTDCGKYITVYYKRSSGKYARGDSPWYTQYRSLDAAATNGCDDKCD